MYLYRKYPTWECSKYYTESSHTTLCIVKFWKNDDLKNVSVVQFRFDDDAGHSISILSAWSVPDVGHGLQLALFHIWILINLCCDWSKERFWTAKHHSTFPEVWTVPKEAKWIQGTSNKDWDCHLKWKCCQWSRKTTIWWYYPPLKSTSVHKWIILYGVYN